MGTITKTLRGVGVGTATITASDGTPRNTITTDVECEIVIEGSFVEKYAGRGALRSFVEDTCIIPFEFHYTPIDITPPTMTLTQDGDIAEIYDIDTSTPGVITGHIANLTGGSLYGLTPVAAILTATSNGAVLDTMYLYWESVTITPMTRNTIQCTVGTPTTFTIAYNPNDVTLPAQYLFPYVPNFDNYTYTFENIEPGVIEMTLNFGESKNIQNMYLFYSSDKESFDVTNANKRIVSFGARVTNPS